MYTLFLYLITPEEFNSSVKNIKFKLRGIGSIYWNVSYFYRVHERYTLIILQCAQVLHVDNSTGCMSVTCWYFYRMHERYMFMFLQGAWGLHVDKSSGCMRVTCWLYYWIFWIISKFEVGRLQSKLTTLFNINKTKWFERAGYLWKVPT